MLRFIVTRLLLLPILMLLFTVVVFAMVQAPPGDFLTSYVAMLASSGSSMDAAQVPHRSLHRGERQGPVPGGR